MRIKSHQPRISKMGDKGRDSDAYLEEESFS
jgi:hypothetical protein